LGGDESPLPYLKGTMKIIELARKKHNTFNKDERKEREAKLRKEHSVMRKGMFEFTDAQGGWIDFTYRFFPDDPIYHIHLTHGEIVDIPMGIVKHINNTMKKVRVMNPELPKNGIATTFEKTSRIRFIPMDVL
jgi:hypothetical protein